MSNLYLPDGPRGYAIEAENRDGLEFNGTDPKVLLQKAAALVPPDFNVHAHPSTIVRILNQGNIGACQGHALATIFSICYFLSTGRWIDFSRAAGYYLSQRKDGIRGDRGSTLYGGQWVATQHGLCLEHSWPYSGAYDPREPAGLVYPYKLLSSKPLKSGDEIFAHLEAGLPVQTGVIWDSSCGREIVDNYDGSNPRSGGHSTVLWQLTTAGEALNLNSWGYGWNGDGIHRWTRNSINRAASNRNNTFIAYGPDMDHPVPDVIKV